MYDFNADANVTRASTPNNDTRIVIVASPNADEPERLHIYANDVWLKSFEGPEPRALLQRANDYVDGIADYIAAAARVEATSPANKRRAYERAQNEAARIRNSNPSYDPPDWMETAADADASDDAIEWFGL